MNPWQTRVSYVALTPDIWSITCWDHEPLTAKGIMCSFDIIWSRLRQHVFFPLQRDRMKADLLGRRGCLGNPLDCSVFHNATWFSFILFCIAWKILLDQTSPLQNSWAPGQGCFCYSTLLLVSSYERTESHGSPSHASRHAPLILEDPIFMNHSLKFFSH